MTSSLIDQREQATLAPYATFSRDSRGRRYPEPDHPYRGPFQRDRDRVIHSGAFRRLSGKMQVFTGSMGDYHRTRLTHTMEVGSISRTIGRALRLNEDLIEALALLHDIGHPPFGHAGEDVLDSLMADYGGFSHNAYALTLVTDIERPYGTLPGLNLTHEVLEAQEARIDKQARTELAPRLEAQVVDAADSITYDAHDCDDAIKLRLLRFEDLRQVELFDICFRRVEQELGSPPPEVLRRAVIHALIDVQVNDLINHTRPQLERSGWKGADEARRSGWKISTSPQLARQKEQLEAYLHENLYRHPMLVRVRCAAQEKIKRLVEFLAAHPQRLPSFYKQRSERIGALPGAVDYVAGMTDRFFEQQYDAFFSNDPSGRIDEPTSTIQPCRP